jgi:hypothetical protein
MQIGMRNPYEVLGLPRTATEAEIKKAFRRIAKDNHPDRTGNDKAASDRFREASNAYELLNDPAKRTAFDRGEIGADGQPANPFAGGFRQEYARGGDSGFRGDFGGGGFGGRDAGFDFARGADDLFADLFGSRSPLGGGGGASGSGFRTQPRGADVACRILVSFIDAARLSDADLARRIRDDGIDILVDLKGFTRDGRLGVLARRPAPIQVTWLGFPGTCGADFVDYIIGDPVVTPLADQAVFSERIAQMPWSYQPNDRQRPLGEPLPRARCGLPAQAFVFCSFNASFKILPPVFERWCRLLRAVPGSVLWLLESNPQAMANLAREAAARGVDPARIVFAPFVPPEQHLPRLMAADLFLDTSPYNAHTTASDALWVGLPVVTCQGETFAARVAASLLRAAGCEELVTHRLDDYEALALALVRDPARLTALRMRLAGSRMTLPLFDSTGFSRDLEALYARMAERHRMGLAPAPLPAGR